MKKNYRKLQREQIFESFEQGNAFDFSLLPLRVASLRKALGITQRQMAKRLGTKQSSFNRTEAKLDSAELKTVARIAKELNCEVLITLKPIESFNSFINKRAALRAEKLLKRTFSNMALEKQSPDNKTYEKRFKELAEELSKNSDSSLWED